MVKKDYLISTIIAVGLIGVGTYLLYKYLTKEKPPEPPIPPIPPIPPEPEPEPPVPPTPPEPPAPSPYLYIWNYVRLEEFSKINDLTGKGYYTLYFNQTQDKFFVRYPRWNGEEKEWFISDLNAKDLITSELVAWVQNVPEYTLNKIGFSYEK